MKNLSESLRINREGVHILTASTGNGMTSTAIHIAMELGTALEAEEGKRKAIVVFSRELGVHEFLRLQEDRYRKAFESMSEKNCEILFFNSYNRDVKDMENTLLQCEQEYEIKGVVIDVIKALTYEGSISPDLQQSIIFLDSVKSQYNCPVIAGLRLNKSMKSDGFDVYDEIIRNVQHIAEYIESTFLLKRHNEMLDVHVCKSRAITDYKPITFNMNTEYAF